MNRVRITRRGWDLFGFSGAIVVPERTLFLIQWFIGRFLSSDKRVKIISVRRVSCKLRLVNDDRVSFFVFERSVQQRRGFKRACVFDVHVARLDPFDGSVSTIVLDLVREGAPVRVPNHFFNRSNANGIARTLYGEIHVLEIGERSAPIFSSPMTPRVQLVPEENAFRSVRRGLRHAVVASLVLAEVH